MPGLRPQGGAGFWLCRHPEAAQRLGWGSSKSIQRRGGGPMCASLSPGRPVMTIRVLLADDHPIVREGMKAVLERHGFTVVGDASDGHEAVRLAKELRPHVVILDLVMPGLN